MADRILNHLCDYALKLSYRDLPQEVIRRTKHIVMDTVGCALGGAESPPAKIARAAASEITSASPSTVLISLAISSHISLEQIRRGQISHWKGCALANASRNAVFCAMLAAKGMTGPEEAFEGKAGFLSSTGIRFEIRPFADSSDTYRIMKARLKAFPSGYFSQSAVEAILNLRSQIPDLDDIKEIRLQTFPAGYEVMGSGEANWHPETREIPDHSLSFVMAVALMEGIVEIRHYDQMYYKRSDVRA